jgi:hypothetical protein
MEANHPVESESLATAGFSLQLAQEHSLIVS